MTLHFYCTSTLSIAHPSSPCINLLLLLLLFSLSCLFTMAGIHLSIRLYDITKPMILEKKGFIQMHTFVLCVYSSTKHYDCCIYRYWLSVFNTVLLLLMLMHCNEPSWELPMMVHSNASTEQDDQGMGECSQLQCWLHFLL